MMRFSFLFYEPIPELAQLERRMARLAELGYWGIELSAAHPMGMSAEQIAALAAKHGLAVASFLSGWSYSNEGLCLSSPDAGVRDRAVARLSEYVRLAAPLGALVVVGLMQGLRGDEPDPVIANDRIAECLRRVASVAEAAGASVVIEPVNHLQVGFNHTVAEAAALVDRIHSPSLSYMLDTLHMHIEERSVVGCMREHLEKARHVHLCETNGGPFGTGALDFAGVLEALENADYQGAVSVKVYRRVGWETAAADSAEFLKRVLNGR